MAKSTKMTIRAAARIMSATAKKHGGMVPKKSAVSRIDAAVQRHEQIQPIPAKARGSKA